MTSPSQFAERVLALVVRDPEWREAVIGDLREEHAKLSARVGAARAKRWHTQQSLRIACRYGTHRLLRRGRFLDVSMPSDRGNYSEETARVIDEEVKVIIAGAHEVALRVLRENRDILERVTRSLLEKEVMEGDELRAMFAAPRAVNL